MDVDDSGEGLTEVLEGMTLEVMQDSANLRSTNAALRERAASLRVSIAQLHQENAAATEQLKTLQARITSQDAALLELQGLRAEVAALQDQVKRMREESTARDEQLRRAQDQLGQQERATALLQDAYNAIRQRLTGQPQPLSSPFANAMYLANPMYGGGQSMVPVNMGQMQAMEGMYFNLPSSVGNISTGSMLGGPSAGPSAGPSVSTIAGSSRTGGDTTSGVASSR
jgi:predicted nuclease with TOPRIM domain